MKQLSEGLAKGLAKMGLDLSAEQRDRLLAYLQLLAKWNKTYNLTAIQEPERMLTHHLLDSLAILPHIKGGRMLDVGSGGGLPGIPLAVAMPNLEVTLLETSGKKCAFLQQAVIELGLQQQVQVAHARVEDFQAAPCFPQVVSRAFSELAEFVRLTRHLLCAHGDWLAMKGAYPNEELALLQGVQVKADYKLNVPGLSADRHLIILEPI